MYEHIKAYLSDPVKFTELINQVYKTLPARDGGGDKTGGYQPVIADWIDRENTAYMTEVVQGIVPGGYPFFPFVVVEKDPEWTLIARDVEELGHSLRYILINVLTDVPGVFLENYGIFHSCTVVCLEAWEIMRATDGACTALAKVQFAENPKLPVLQIAKKDYITLNLGREPFSGTKCLNDHMQSPKPEEQALLEAKVVDVRSMEMTSAVKKFLMAYEEDIADMGGKADTVVQN